MHRGSLDSFELLCMSDKAMKQNAIQKNGNRDV